MPTCMFAFLTCRVLRVVCCMLRVAQLRISHHAQHAHHMQPSTHAHCAAGNRQSLHSLNYACVAHGTQRLHNTRATRNHTTATESQVRPAAAHARCAHITRTPRTCTCACERFPLQGKRASCAAHTIVYGAARASCPACDIKECCARLECVCAVCACVGDCISWCA